MSRRVDFTLTDEQRASVEYAINHSPLSGVRQRATAIGFLRLGHKPEVVAEMVGGAASTIWIWHRLWWLLSPSGTISEEKHSPARDQHV